MEFLMTYGWAIMAFVIAISALSYFSPTIFKSPLPEVCISSTSAINCKEFVVGKNGINLILQNNGIGYDLNNVIISVRNINSGSCSNSPEKTINDGQSTEFTLNCNGLIEGKKLNAEIVISYKKSGSLLSNTASATLNSRIQGVSVSDVTAPVITNLQETGITSSSATISWNTDEASNSSVRYGTSSGSYTQQASDSSYITLHSIPLNGLSASTTYFYIVNSADSSGNKAQSPERSFTTTTSQQSCTGTAWACSNFYDQPTCNAQLGCYWDGFGEFCDGGAYPCSGYTSQSTCQNQQGCTWQ
ncbi:MAG: fibronectin type III domain-containing protein [Nanoarchaeota archaeon]